MAFASLLRSRAMTRGMIRATFVVAGIVGLSVLATQPGTGATAHASPGLRYQHGYYLDNGWLCYGWSNGAYHCTRHWHTSGGRLISDNSAWVPNSGGGGSGAHGARYTSSTPSTTPRGIGPWVYTGIPAHAMGDFAGDPYHGYFGVCTWYAWYRHQSEPLMRLGNAAAWAWNAPAHGLRVGSRPAVGATVVFQSGVQGASGLGHVAHVERVYSNGWFLVSEMSFYWNGGGWGRVSYRYVHTGPGVSFIY